MEDKDRIKKLEEFKSLMTRYFEGSNNPDIRSAINRKKSWVRREVLEARCLRTYTVTPPPITGGMIMKNIDPFGAIFNPPYGQSVLDLVLDMIDETIGVIMFGDAPEKPNKVSITTEPDYEEGYAFIAMAIDPNEKELEDVLDSIKEAATKCGIQAERVDDVQSNDRITDRILESIRKAQFVIVDLTHSRPNVFYEAGYAQALNKTPVYIAKQGTKLQFDLKDYPVILLQ